MCKLKVSDFLEHNRNWVGRILLDQKPDYFNQLCEGQQPSALLLGCSDSRVSPSKVFGVELGDLFIHRNIANVVNPTDLNFLSVLQYAVEVLKIRDIIIYGHYGCGGIRAAYENKGLGLIDNWLAPIKVVANQHQKELDLIQDENRRLDRLVELNVLAQVENIKQTSIYRAAAHAGISLRLHPWVFDMHTGLVKELQIPIQT
ncbi:carbonic anhydrase [Pararhodonellum marinum]|uniref:carbonic anhydrase n=1 Tax=Pararhodonellum marinum TaxID=2755358 RepID=UPI00188EBC7E|nr:carbonic anhydrase [Pararhodonellum marinum]